MAMNTHGMLGRQLGRALLVLILASLEPACYSKSGKTYSMGGGPVGGPGTITLFTDGFVFAPGALGTADPNWTAVIDAGTAANVVFPGVYYLDFTMTVRNAGAAIHATGTVTTHFASKPVTFTVSFEPPASTGLTQHDLMSIIIKDSSSATIVSRADFDVITGMFTFNTNGSMSTTSPSTGSFHNVVFSIDAGGNATWTIGAFTSAPVAAAPPTMVDLQLQSTYAAGTGSAPLFRFASVLVTTP
jgi:hypothetical protein